MKLLNSNVFSKPNAWRYTIFMGHLQDQVCQNYARNNFFPVLGRDSIYLGSVCQLMLCAAMPLRSCTLRFFFLKWLPDRLKNPISLYLHVILKFSAFHFPNFKCYLLAWKKGVSWFEMETCLWNKNASAFHVWGQMKKNVFTLLLNVSCTWFDIIRT